MAENVVAIDGKPDRSPDDRDANSTAGVNAPDAASVPVPSVPPTPPAVDPSLTAGGAADAGRNQQRDEPDAGAGPVITLKRTVDAPVSREAQKEVADRPAAPASWLPPRPDLPEVARPSGTLAKIFAPSDHHKVFDLQFERAHRRLVDLAAFAGQLSKPLGGMAAVAARLGPLNTLKFTNSPTGRDATDAEWIAVEERTQEVWNVLSDTDRRRFNSTQVPGSFTTLVMTFLAFAILSVGFAYWNVATKDSTPPALLGAFLAFVVASGAMGAAASIGMNALSVQDDATFDLSVRKFLWLRVSLGALFGTLLTLPWAFPVFQDFVQELGKVAVKPSNIKAEQLQQAAWLLSPFVLGFSTSLVILVLTRMVEAIQTVFGKSAPK